MFLAHDQNHRVYDVDGDKVVGRCCDHGRFLKSQSDGLTEGLYAKLRSVLDNLDQQRDSRDGLRLD